MRQAVFLDRDGAMIKDCGFLKSPSDVKFYASTIAALQLLQKKFTLIIVTNQCGIANGLITHEEVDLVNQFIIEYLAAHGIKITDCYVCPHAIGGGCECRKPRPYFAEQAASRYNLDLSRSYMIGDHMSDMKFAEAFGGQGMYVMTGHGSHERNIVPDNIPVSKNILYAARRIEVLESGR